MKNSKRIFSAVFASLLVVMSVVVISLYDNVRDNTPRNNDLVRYLDDDMGLLTIALAKQLDTSYEPISFTDRIDEGSKQIFLNLFDDCLDNIMSSFNSDSDFIYQATNMANNQTIGQQIDKINATDNQNKYSLYGEVIYNQDGLASTKGDLVTNYFSNLDVFKILNSFIDYSDSNIICIDGWEFNRNDIEINEPKNLQVKYIIPESPTHFGYASQYVNLPDDYNSFSLVSLLCCSAILALFFLFYPIRIVEEVNPFLSLKKCKAEIIFVGLTIAIVFGTMGCMMVTGYTLNNSLLELFARYEIIYADIVLLLINFIVWVVTFLCISLGLFELKYIFANGFIRFLKEDTLIGSGIKWIKQKLDLISEIDLSKPLNKTIMKYVLVNLVVIAIMITFWGFGYFLAIIYAFVSFFWIKNQVTKIQEDYERLLMATKELSRGNFDVEINSDVGVFNSLNDEFKNIRIGFETAVKEEIKSQNMKNELITNVSHDLKTPLTCIKNYIVLLQDDDLSVDTRHDYLDNLNQYSNRLTKLIEDLFEVSKVNSGNIKLNPVDLDIVSLLKQTHAECSEMLETRNLTVISNYPENDVILQLDGDKTYRIFENLFTNISKYALTGSRVYLDVSDEDDELVIIFKNISQEQMNFSSEEIIERFVRGDKSRHESGSGLGLAIAKSFTEAQGGEFSIDIDGDLFKAIIKFKKGEK